MSSGNSTWRALRRGQKLARRGRLDDALAAFDAAGDVGHPPFLVQHALALAGAGRLEAAVEKAAKAAAADPDDAVPAAFHAYLLLRAGRLAAARAELGRAESLGTRNPLVRSLRAALALLRGEVRDGCRGLLGGPLTDNLDVLGWTLGVLERKLFERAGANTGALPPESDLDRESDELPRTLPQRSARACARKGKKRLETGRPNGAAAFLGRAVSLAPENAEYRTMYGAALFEAGDFERAESELAAVPQEDAAAGVAQFYRAANAYRLGRYEQAMELLNTLPMSGDAFLYQEWFDYVRGMALVALDRTDEAAPHLAAFLATDPALMPRRLARALALFEEEAPCSTPS